MVEARETLLITALMLAIIMPLVISYGTEYVTCDNDAQCSSTEFCYVSGLCVPCLDCTTYHRQQPSFLDCIKDAKQCGGCFDGWKDEIFTNGERRDSCIKSRIHFKQTMVAEQYSSDPVLRFAQLGQFALVAITASVFLIGGLLWCRTNWAKPSRVLPSHNLLPEGQAKCSRNLPSQRDGSQGSGQESRPTATTHFWEYPASETLANNGNHTTDTPQTSRSSTAHAGSEVVHTTIFTAEGFKDAPQQAIPFRWPRYEMDNASEANELENDLQQTTQSPQSPDISFLHDEDTMPSSWSPNNESTSSTGTNTCNSTTVDQDVASGTDDSNEPQPKRIRVGDSESDSGIDVFQAVSNQESFTGETGINLYITNNVVIRKA